MKKQIKKLSLNKKTISNLQPSEMGKIVGASGAPSCSGCHGHTIHCTGGCTNKNTCHDHNTCYTC